MTTGQVALLCAAVAAGAGGLGWSLGQGGAGSDTATEIGALRNEVSALRAELAAKGGDAQDADAAFVAFEIARYKATLARQRFAVTGALEDEKDPAERDAMKRALATIDAVEFDLKQVTDPDSLARWFNTTMVIRQRWPSQHAWLLPDLKWR